jgi:RHS repeat-associated protein
MMNSPDLQPSTSPQNGADSPVDGGTLQSVGTAADSGFSQSSALSFASFRRGQVDPRTGSFTYRIPIARLTGNELKGPTIELYLNYDHFIKRDEGFGEGWTLGLSRVINNNSRKKVLLRDGRIIDRTERGVIQTVGVNDYKFSALGTPANAYQIAYKEDGTIETLEPRGSTNSYTILTKLTSENGFELNLEYDSSSVVPWLSRIYDESGKDLLSVTRQFVREDSGYLTGEITFDFYPGSARASSMKFFCSSDDVTQIATLRGCQMQFDSPLPVLQLSYKIVDGFCLISKVESDFTGYALELIDYDASLNAPPNAPWASLPAVSAYSFSMTSAGTGTDKKEEHTYSYGGDDANNFLGYNGVTAWDDSVVDNIYSCPSTYQYTSKDVLKLDGVETHTTTRVYDKFHRTVTETVQAPAYFIFGSGSPIIPSIAAVYTYPGTVKTPYASLPPQYKFPTQTLTTYKNEIDGGGTSTERTTTQTASFDVYGNVLTQSLSGGMENFYEYYPSKGTTLLCPAEKNAFVRYVKTAVKRKTGVKTDLIRTTYIYGSTQLKENCPYTVLTNEQGRRTENSIELKGMRDTNYNYYDWDDETEPDNRGRLRRCDLVLGVPGFSKTTSTVFTYTFSADRTNLTVTSRQGIEGVASLSEQKQEDALTGWLLKLVDSLGVATEFGYDGFGRMTSLTRAVGTESESKTTYSFSVDDQENQNKTTQVPTMFAVVETFDALGNVVKEVSVKMVEEVPVENLTRIAEYDTRHLLVKEVFHDIGVPMIENAVEIESVLDITNTYQYDSFGNLSKASYQNGTCFNRDFAIGSAKLVEYWTSASTPDDVQGDYNYTVTNHDLDNMLPLTIKEYRSDGETLTSTTTYGYDNFLRFNELKVADAKGNILKSYKCSYDIYDRVSNRDEYDGDTKGRVTTLTYWGGGLEPKITSVAVNTVVVATRNYDELGRLSTIYRNPNGGTPERNWATTCVYNDGYTTPAIIASPRDLKSTYEYVKELGCLVSSVKPDQGASFSYIYDRHTIKLSSETITGTTGSQIRQCGYDGNGLLTSEQVQRTDEQTSERYQNTFERTASGRVKSIKTLFSDYPVSKVKYFYDSAGRMSTIRFNWKEADVVYLEVDLKYYFDDFPGEMIYSFKKTDGTDIKFDLLFTYDEKLRLTYKKYGYPSTADPSKYDTLAGDGVEYNCLGQVIAQYTSSGTGGNNYTEMEHQFDYLGRLISCNANVDVTTVYPTDSKNNDISSFGFTYDDYDNITSETLTLRVGGDQEIRTYTYDGGNPFALTQISAVGPGSTEEIAVSYDQSGNVTSLKWVDDISPEWTFSYDLLEKLIGCERADEQATSVAINRNSQGKMLETKVAQTVGCRRPGEITTYGYCDGLFSNSWRKAVRDNPEMEAADYLHATTNVDVVSVLKGAAGNYTASRRMQLSDVSGNVFAEVDPDAGSYPKFVPLVYHPYGDLPDPLAPPGYDPVRFKGARYDALTEVYHLGDGNRAYDQWLKRFLQYDSQSPFGAGGLNPYAYCSGDPVTYFDPSGQSRTVSIVLAAVGIAVGFYGLLAAMGGLLAAAAAGAGISLGAKVGAALGIGSAVTGIASGATGIAGAVHEGEVSDQLNKASYALGVVSLAAAWVPVGIGAFRMALKLQAAQELALHTSIVTAGASVASKSITISNQLGLRTSPAQVGGARLFGKTIALAFKRSQTFKEAVLAGEIYYMLDGSGPLAALASSASPMGMRLNAEGLVDSLGSAAVAMTDGQPLCDMTGGPFPGIDSAEFGTPWFPKLTRYSPRIRSTT